MKRLANIALNGLRVAVVIGALLALVVSGAGAAHRLFTEQMTPDETRPVSVSASFDDKPDPLEATGGMATGSCPSTEQSFWIQSNPGLPCGGDQSHRLVSASMVGVMVDQFHFYEGYPVCQSAGRVAPQIGHRFTLVGARPSGTS
jgi:hypothetical protein